MRDFIKSNYYEFVESIQKIHDCNTIIGLTEDAIGNLDENIQVLIENLSSTKFLDFPRKLFKQLC